MSKTFFLKSFFWLASIFVAFLVPHSVMAADVFFRVVPNTEKIDTSTVIEVRINPEDKNINAVEGVLKLEENSTNSPSSVVVETGGSVLTLWPVTPMYNNVDNTIRFSGGVPEGFNQESLLFRIRIVSPQSKVIKLSWLDGSGFLNDGQGTADGVSARSIKVALLANTPNVLQVFSLDTKPPQFDSVKVSKDQSVFDDNYFVSFHATDDISGVSYYEVREDKEMSRVTDGVYVLKDQEQKTPVFITAYDKAGNSSVIRVPIPFEWLVKAIILGAVLLALILIFLKRKRFLKFK